MKILVSANASIMDGGERKWVCFYEGFIKTLIAEGNDVRALNTRHFLAHAWAGDNELWPFLSQEKIAEDIRLFAPDLIIAFNHSVPKVILENTGCKIAVWDADSLEYYCDKPYILKNLERYVFLCFSSAGVENALKFGAHGNQTFLCMSATAVEAEDRPVEQNISFIGTMFAMPENFIRMLRENDPSHIRRILHAFDKNFYADHEQILKEQGGEWTKAYIDPAGLARIPSVEMRNSLLNDLQELGLAIYGSQAWQDIGIYLPWLALCYNPQKIYTLKHNQDVYNASKICINISHAQATSGFPWRVMDIMASNGCLVSDKKPDLAEFTKGYVTIPMYESRSEAVDLCKRLLSDEGWRRDIVAGSQECIQAKGSWEIRIRELSGILGMQLHHEGARPETCEIDIYAHTMNPASYTSFLSKKLRGLKKVLSFIPIAPLRFVYYALRLNKIGLARRYAELIMQGHTIR